MADLGHGRIGIDDPLLVKNFSRMASVLVEVDARTGFTDHLIHTEGQVPRPAELKRNLFHVSITDSTNTGLEAMAESRGMPYDVLAWTAEW